MKRIPKETQAFLNWATDRGWRVERLKRGNHLKLTREGCQSVFCSSTPSDRRAFLNSKSDIRRAEQEAGITDTRR